MNSIYLGLVHYPVRNKRGEIVTTSVTNLDIHDIARSSKTFGVKNYFLITPLVVQHELVGRILNHWEGDEASAYNPDRQNALSIVKLTSSVEEAVSLIEKLEGKSPIIAVTGANFKTIDGDTNSLKNKMLLANRPCFLLFGTGWGLDASLVERADFRLESIHGNNHDDYNHLSVRSAVAIYLDRLRGGLSS